MKKIFIVFTLLLLIGGASAVYAAGGALETEEEPTIVCCCCCCCGGNGIPVEPVEPVEPAPIENTNTNTNTNTNNNTVIINLPPMPDTIYIDKSKVHIHDNIHPKFDIKVNNHKNSGPVTINVDNSNNTKTNNGKKNK